jgi:hypothetical protein
MGRTEKGTKSHVINNCCHNACDFCLFPCGPLLPTQFQQHICVRCSFPPPLRTILPSANLRITATCSSFPPLLTMLPGANLYKCVARSSPTAPPKDAAYCKPICSCHMLQYFSRCSATHPFMYVFTCSSKSSECSHVIFLTCVTCEIICPDAACCNPTRECHMLETFF